MSERGLLADEHVPGPCIAVLRPVGWGSCSQAAFIQTHAEHTGMTESVRDERHSGGAPTIGETGIRVINVASAYEHSGYSPDEIAEFYPPLSLSDIHTALAYYYAHIDEFRDVDAGNTGDTRPPA